MLFRSARFYTLAAPKAVYNRREKENGPSRCRTYITLSDEEAFEAAFPPAARLAVQPPVQEVCPVTHKAALYRDPVTDISYANTRAFRIIREAYRKYVAAHGFPNSSLLLPPPPCSSHLLDRKSVV